MSDENKTAMLILIAVAAILGWVLARAVHQVAPAPDCERYWQQMAMYLQTENDFDAPEFIQECATQIPAE